MFKISVLFCFLCLVALPAQDAPESEKANPEKPAPSTPVQPIVANPVTSPTLAASDLKIYPLSLEEAEKSFVEKNLLLLAAKFQIDAKRALVMQAGLYANPSVFLETSIYSHKTAQFLDATENGSQVIQIQQLFLMGGKIDKRIKVAEINKSLTENEFYNVLRALKFELRNTFFSLHFMRESVMYYDQTIEALGRTVKGAEVALSRRAITKAEYLRLKALNYFLRNERANIMVNVRLKEVNLRVLMNRPELAENQIVPMVDEKLLENAAANDLNIRQLVEQAESHRPDIKTAMLNLKYETANLDLQEANAIPDDIAAILVEGVLLSSQESAEAKAIAAFVTPELVAKLMRVRPKSQATLSFNSRFRSHRLFCSVSDKRTTHSSPTRLKLRLRTL